MSDRLTEIAARAAAKQLTPGPFRLGYESCDCGGDYPCGHGMCVTGVYTSTPTPAATDRYERTGEKPRDYDFHRGEICDFSRDDWELMAHAREDVPWLLEQLEQARGIAVELENENARLTAELEQHGHAEDGGAS
ncbi:hypothetical protein [Streptomyces sp. NPDC059649]|uniref:hypothetical protein n=1 Tax=Streptomyces sp. NPDC059649 TaxID=3346895 RepID=UPI00368F2E6A